MIRDSCPQIQEKLAGDKTTGQISHLTAREFADGNNFT